MSIKELKIPTLPEFEYMLYPVGEYPLTNKTIYNPNLDDSLYSYSRNNDYLGFKFILPIIRNGTDTMRFDTEFSLFLKNEKLSTGTYHNFRSAVGNWLVAEIGNRSELKECQIQGSLCLSSLRSEDYHTRGLPFVTRNYEHNRAVITCNHNGTYCGFLWFYSESSRKYGYRYFDHKLEYPPLDWLGGSRHDLDGDERFCDKPEEFFQQSKPIKQGLELRSNKFNKRFITARQAGVGNTSLNGSYDEYGNYRRLMA